jgi:hypothetical protein
MGTKAVTAPRTDGDAKGLLLSILNEYVWTLATPKATDTFQFNLSRRDHGHPAHRPRLRFRPC